MVELSPSWRNSASCDAAVQCPGLSSTSCANAGRVVISPATATSGAVAGGNTDAAPWRATFIRRITMSLRGLVNEEMGGTETVGGSDTHPAAAAADVTTVVADVSGRGGGADGGIDADADVRGCTQYPSPSGRGGENT